jgi:GNAT superfamily N-acetyltransferase
MTAERELEDPGSVGPEVRPARPDDLAAVALLYDRLSEEQEDWRVFPPRPGIRGEFLGRLGASIEDPTALLLVAAVEGEVVGMAFAHETTPSSFSDERAMELSAVVVRQEHRGGGVGRALTEAAARFARDRGIPRLILKVFDQNHRARAFWEAVGFSPRMVQMTARPDDVLRSRGIRGPTAIPGERAQG